MKDNKHQEKTIQVTNSSIPILYTDMIFMNVNEDGVVIDICQKMGSKISTKLYHELV